MVKLYILCGIPFAGKTTLAKEMEKTLGIKRIDLDEIKFEMFDSDIRDNDLKQADWDRVYARIYKNIAEILSQGHSLIYDTGNFTKKERDLIRDIADEIGDVEIVTVYVNTPKEVALKRLVENEKNPRRFGVNKGDFETAVSEMEIPKEDENSVTFEDGENPGEWISQNLA